MAVYVDDARIPARVGRIRARWSHLYADSQDELHAFAQSIGLKRAWFQPGKPIAGQPSRLWHYDVTDAMRARAIATGAQPVGIREFREIINRRDGVAPAVTPPSRGSKPTRGPGATRCAAGEWVGLETDLRLRRCPCAARPISIRPRRPTRAGGGVSTKHSPRLEYRHEHGCAPASR